MSMLAAKKKEAFAQAVAAGATLADAYRKTRDTSRMKPSTIRSNAKKLAREPAVQARIEELRGRESGSPRESSGSAEPTGAPRPAPSETDLRVKQERFLQLFLEKGNASEAYRQAYDVSPDTKPETIHRCAAELLANPKVTTRFDELRAELRKRHDITTDYLVEQLRPIIEADIRKVVTWGEAVPVRDPETGEVTIAQGIAIKAPSDLDAAAAAMIAEIVQSRDGTVRVRLHDKLIAVEKVAKLLGLMKDQHDVNLKDVTPPRPRDPGREVIMQSVRAFLTAANDYEARIAADEAERKGS